uniref:Prokineticin-1 n=1 Tax=Geotrypetes seraphini TaxID=260995 RepID=A0A6P8P0H4_GEOSA|nr:prokineticin-1 [Geotrypetes seraphini]
MFDENEPVELDFEGFQVNDEMVMISNLIAYVRSLSSENVNRLEACERDLQCGVRTCCAISLWLRGLRMCIPLGQEGEECHPFSHKVPFLGKRQHHTCPCLANLICSKFLDGRYRCSVDFKNVDFS